MHMCEQTFPDELFSPLMGENTRKLDTSNKLPLLINEKFKKRLSNNKDLYSILLNLCSFTDI